MRQCFIKKCIKCSSVKTNTGACRFTPLDANFRYFFGDLGTLNSFAMGTGISYHTFVHRASARLI